MHISSFSIKEVEKVAKEDVDKIKAFNK